MNVLDKIIEAGKQGGWLLALIVAAAALGFAAIAAFNPVEEGADQAWNLAFSPAAPECPAGTSPLEPPTGGARIHADTGEETDLLCDHPDWRLTRFENGEWQGLHKVTGETRTGKTAAEILR